ncbi:MAG: GNAT family N-acetyltransferase [Leptolyngbyaceae cyanobacterium RM2_2_4]|nr:GNAT family N-acetyltransferase [Leptolyngbyaceae cyanobacterium SM1_4_3]NJN90656.1 GNAT family N-acetyltransferase [Leptolyngbyaceae cyanobacterium SL_5_14]NJO53235.1 GNAT family N-acetyltransferase [Leptolyngbyaceae cyanobacterium RM2_2_4]
MSNLVIRVVSYTAEKTAIQAIRHQVFQVEQGVDPALEFDGQDETAIHLLAQIEAEPVGTARIRLLSEQLAKIERVAVLSSCRGQGIGKRLMEEAIVFLNTKNIPETKVNAQLYVKDFYQKLGFEQRGEVFEEAGISHVEMRLRSL